jgi:hypothetical protein
VAVETGGGLSVTEFGVAEDLEAESGEAWVVFEEFLAGVDVVVDAVVLAIVIEP